MAIERCSDALDALGSILHEGLRDTAFAKEETESLLSQPENHVPGPVPAEEFDINGRVFVAFSLVDRDIVSLL